MTEPDKGKYELMVDGTEIKFKRLNERKPGESWILLYYGPSKAGKTWFAGTAGSRTLFINIGDGLETLLSPGFRARYPDSSNMIVVDIREQNPSGIAEAFDLVTKAINHAFNNFADEFDTVVLDEATAFRKFAINKAMVINKRKGGDRESRIKSFVKPEIDDFGMEMAMVEWFLGKYIPTFKERGKHFIMLAHERRTYGKPDSIGGEAPLKRIMPGFTGKTFPDTVPAYFDDVWRAEAIGTGANRVYRAQTAGNEKEAGGARHNGLFGTVEPDPNFLKLLERIRKGELKR